VRIGDDLFDERDLCDDEDCEKCYPPAASPVPPSAPTWPEVPGDDWDCDEKPQFASLEGYCERCRHVVQCHRLISGKLKFFEHSEDGDLEPHVCVVKERK
jgi:hypothetical protein